MAMWIRTGLYIHAEGEGSEERNDIEQAAIAAYLRTHTRPASWSETSFADQNGAD